MQNFFFSSLPQKFSNKTKQLCVQNIKQDDDDGGGGGGSGDDIDIKVDNLHFPTRIKTIITWAIKICCFSFGDMRDDSCSAIHCKCIDFFFSSFMLLLLVVLFWVLLYVRVFHSRRFYIENNGESPQWEHTSEICSTSNSAACNNSSNCVKMTKMRGTMELAHMVNTRNASFWLWLLYCSFAAQQTIFVWFFLLLLWIV